MRPTRAKPSPTAQLLLLELRAGRRDALDLLRATLDAHGGSIRATAIELGIGERTVHRLREWPAPAAVLAEHAAGRGGTAAGAQAMGPIGRQCDGSGECSAARLHRLKYRCSACGGESFDHDTKSPDEPFCITCGADVRR